MTNHHPDTPSAATNAAMNHGGHDAPPPPPPPAHAATATHESTAGFVAVGFAPKIAHLAAEAGQRLKFHGRSGFQAELRRRVDEYFEKQNAKPRDCPQMYLKTAVLMGGFVLSYILLVFVAQTWWQGIPAAIFLGLMTAGVGLNIQHDGGHCAGSSRAWVNRLMAMSLDVIGGSSYMWHWKHGVFHHTYTNVTGHDTDIDFGAMARMTPHQKRYFFHRLQHYYIWFLYGLMAVRWHLFGDFQQLVTGRICEHPIPRPKGWDLVIFIAGKVIFFSLAFGIPLFLYPVWVVAVYYGIVALVLGITLSIVFQLAHCVEDAAFAMPSEETGQMENAWAIHQVESTVDFARRSRLAAWLLGGLNFQIEHHLFPRISHVNYPGISRVVEQTCRDFGIKYNEHKSFWSGVVSHVMWLRQMGMPTSK